MVVKDFATWQGLRARDPRRLALGTVQWGQPYGVANRTGVPDDAELAAMLTRAAAAGVYTLDTARAYGQAEQRIGAALAARADGRAFRVVTKLAPDVHGSGLDLVDTLERVAASLDASRAALGREDLPVLLLHRFAHRHAGGGKLWRTLLAERDAGRIGALGVSAASPEEAWAALDDPDVEVLQVATSLLDLRLVRQDFFARARELGRTIYVRSVFLQGVAHLEPEMLPPFLAPLAAPLHTIRAAARDLDLPPRALFLAFAREWLPGAQPVLGCERDAQLAELLADWSDPRIDAATIGRLLEELPTLDASLVDPTCWPSPPPPAAGPAPRAARGATAPANQTPAGSVATLPR